MEHPPRNEHENPRETANDAGPTGDDRIHDQADPQDVSTPPLREPYGGPRQASDGTPVRPDGGNPGPDVEHLSRTPDGEGPEPLVPRPPP